MGTHKRSQEAEVRSGRHAASPSDQPLPKRTADEPTSFVHRLALCESDEVGVGTRIWAFAHVMQGARIGCECNIGDHVFIESGAVLGDRVVVKNGAMIWDGVTIEDEAFIGPGVVFTNDRFPRSRRLLAAEPRYAHVENWREPTLVRHGTSIGARAIILCGVSLGAYACIAAGAVVTKDVPDHGLVLGHPARVVGWVCACGARLPDSLTCRACSRHYAMKHGRLSAAE